MDTISPGDFPALPKMANGALYGLIFSSLFLGPDREQILPRRRVPGQSVPAVFS